VLAQQFTVLKTEKNFNNLVGLPWTLFRLQPRHQYAVLELGMNAPGEIDRLGSIAEPQVGVITNIARAHLEGLGSLARVAKAKGELLYHLKPEGLAVLNADDPRVLALRRKTKARVVTYGFSREAALRGQDFKNDGFKGCRFKVRLRGRFYPFQLSLAGRHNAVNALAAIAVGREYGIRPQQMQQALRQITLPQGRLDRHRLAGGTLLINDSYNANPDSMHAALNLIKEQKHSGRKILVLGDMLELGPASIRFHREIGAAAVAAGADQLIAVGQNAKHLVSGAKNAGMKANEIHCSPSAKQAGKILQEIVQPGDLIFLKGSRGIHLEETLKTFTDGKAAACF